MLFQVQWEAIEGVKPDVTGSKYLCRFTMISLVLFGTQVGKRQESNLGDQREGDSRKPNEIQRCLALRG